jgi:hypothetical protein
LVEVTCLYLPELEVGQLVKDPYFTLFESVGALEVRRFWIYQEDVMLSEDRSWTERWIVGIWNLAKLWKMNMTSAKLYFRRRLLGL